MTHSPVLNKFSQVLDTAEIPITQRQPNQKMDEIGAALKLLFSFTVEISITGVPKYKIEGVHIL
ncbi:hypothetical protein CLA01_43040 [Chryseobacterium lathyri]|uniref:Uncharacterized protein n=1 Tax=Chryseobacterium lathyri TaxID=395933 RepID=A0A511YG98_9FLAO|nr:hypothetical protein CLA01_43040 [Chryseobacterium lathyri]